MNDAGARVISVLGLGAMIAIAWVFSSDRSRVPWPTVAWGIGLQLVLGVLLLKTPLGSLFFAAMNAMRASRADSSFSFAGPSMPSASSSFVRAWPTRGSSRKLGRSLGSRGGSVLSFFLVKGIAI